MPSARLAAFSLCHPRGSFLDVLHLDFAFPASLDRFALPLFRPSPRRWGLRQHLGEHICSFLWSWASGKAPTRTNGRMAATNLNASHLGSRNSMAPVHSCFTVCKYMSYELISCEATKNVSKVELIKLGRHPTPGLASWTRASRTRQVVVACRGTKLSQRTGNQGGRLAARQQSVSWFFTPSRSENRALLYFDVYSWRHCPPFSHYPRPLRSNAGMHLRRTS